MTRDQAEQKQKGVVNSSVCQSFMALGWFQVLSPITAGCTDPQRILTEAAGSQLLAATSLLITVGWELPLAKAISQPPVSPETKTTARRKICNTMMCIWVLIWHPEEKHQLQRLLRCRCQVMSLAQAYVFLAAEFGLRWPPELGQEGGRHPSATLPKSHTLSLTSPERCAGEPLQCRMGEEHGQGTRTTQAMGYTRTTGCCSTSQADSLYTGIRLIGMGHLTDMHSLIAW